MKSHKVTASIIRTVELESGEEMESSIRVLGTVCPAEPDVGLTSSYIEDVYCPDGEKLTLVEEQRALEALAFAAYEDESSDYDDVSVDEYHQDKDW